MGDPQNGWFIMENPSTEQCSKPWLVDDHKGLYYLLYIGVYNNPIGESL